MIFIIIFLTIFLIISIIIRYMNIEFIKVDSIEEKTKLLKKKPCNCGKKPKRNN